MKKISIVAIVLCIVTIFVVIFDVHIEDYTKKDYLIIKDSLFALNTFNQAQANDGWGNKIYVLGYYCTPSVYVQTSEHSETWFNVYPVSKEEYCFIYYEKTKKHLVMG